MTNLPNGTIIAFEMGHKALTAKIIAQNESRYLVEVERDAWPWKTGNELFVRKDDSSLVLIKEYVAQPEPVKPVFPENQLETECGYPTLIEIQQTKWWKMFFSWWK